MGPRGMNARDAAARLRVVSTPIERFSDSVLKFVAPKSALVRAHRRLMERDSDYRENWLGESGLLAARGYKTAQSPTNGTPWLNTSNRAADSELLLDLPTLRARNRQIERDDSLGSGVIRTRVRQVVGSGLRPQAATKAGRELNDTLEEIWNERQGSLFPAEGRISFAQAQRIIYTRLLVDGEVFLSRAKSAPGEPVWFELVEADRVGTPMDAKPDDPDGRVVDGVEKDKHGRVVAYFVAKQHPGEQVHIKTVGKPFTVVALTKTYYDRVPADRIRHLRYRLTRPGQTRGVPLMHACMQDFHDLDLLTLALIKRTQVAACLSMFITSDQAIADLFEVTAEDYGYQLDQQLEPGMIFKLFPGEKVEQSAVGFSVPDIEPVQKGIAKRIGAACEMSPEAVLHDWGATNYSSARTVQIEDNRSYDTDRADLADQGLGWVWTETLADAQLMGDSRLRGVAPAEFKPARWVGDARPWVDPQSEAAATMSRMALRLTTKRDEAAAQGKDWEEILEQQLTEEKREAEMRQSMGLPDAVPMDASGKPVPPPPEPAPAPKSDKPKRTWTPVGWIESKPDGMDDGEYWERFVLPQMTTHLAAERARAVAPSVPALHITNRVEAPAPLPPAAPPVVNANISVQPAAPAVVRNEITVPPPPPPPAPLPQPAPVVNVSVNVPEQPAPIVNNTVNIPEPKVVNKEIKVFRDLNGDISAATSTETPQE